MATLNVWTLGGLDQKSNDLTRATDKASDMQNVEYDTQSTIKKRTGYSSYLTYDHNDMVYFQQKDEILLFKDGSSTVKIVTASTGVSRNLTMPFSVTKADISYTENQQNLYFTSTDLSIPVMKYDGSNIYRAGLPAPRQETYSSTLNSPTMTNTTSGYTRIFYSFKDINGNETFSPFYQFSTATTGSSVISVNTFKTSSTLLEQGFLYKYCWYTKTSSQSLSSSSRTLTDLTHNYVAGDSFLFEQDVTSDDNINRITLTSNKTYLKWDVESVTSTTITFTASSIGSDTVVIPAKVSRDFPIDIRTKLHIYSSSSSDFGYTPVGVHSGQYVIDANALTNTQNMAAIFEINPYNTGYQKTAFEDVYDSTTLKIMPPYSRYIGSYGNQIIYGNVGKFFNDDNTPVNYDNGDLIVYSDLLSGDGPENVSPLNFQKIGETYEADITGLRRCNDSFIIYKRNGVFSLDGFLQPSQYQLRKISTNYVGCTSHKSILETDNGVYFQAHNGIYFTNGINVTKVSYELDPFFGSGKFELTRSVRFKAKQKALFYVDGSSFTDPNPPHASKAKVVVVDYYYGQVYFWTNIGATNGFVEDVNGNVYFSNGSSIFKFDNTIFNDNGSAIDAYYSTTYHHCGVPSLRKKFLGIRIYALTSDVFSLKVYHDKDWSGNSNQNPHDLNFSLTDQTKLLVHDMQTCRSQRYTFRNSVVNEPMVLTGYDIHWEAQQQNDKD